MVKSNKLFKILAVVLIVLSIVNIMGVFSTVHAAGPSIDEYANGSMINQPNGNASTKIKGVAGNVLWIIQAVGIVAGVVIIAYMGIKYIISSPDGKAEIKKQAYVYVLGAAFVMLAPVIANAVFKAVQ